MDRKKYLTILFVLILLWMNSLKIYANANVEIEAPSGILIESETGTVVFEKNPDEKRSPASITKIMTLLLIYDALEKGRIQLEDEVVTSAYAKSMGGSQVFLEEGEIQTVETLIKCIVIASGNDASVAMAEHLEGSEAEFVAKMNQKAKELGMKNTNFQDCCGLTDSEEHYTTARDIAIMSRELIQNYPQILKYSSIWMENIIHKTAKGSSEFGLTNTNKLLRMYEGCVGLKTGSTSIAKYCLSAVAERKGIKLISVIMAAPDYKVRFRDAASLLDYGFAKCNLYTDQKPEKLPEISVTKGVDMEVSLMYEQIFRYLNTDGTVITDVSKKIELPEKINAPVHKGQIAGKVVYFHQGKKLGEINILFAETILKASYKDCYMRVLRSFF